MSCPRCGSTLREMIGPALFLCTNVLYDRTPVPPPIGRQFDLRYQDVAYRCGSEYREGIALTGQAACPEHGLFSTGTCSGCRSTAICGRCGGWKCRRCRTKDEAAEAAAYRARQAKEEVARQAKEAAHAATHAAKIAAHRKKQPKSQQQYIAEIRSLEREIVATNGKLRTSVTKFSVSYAISALVGFGFWIVALVIIASPARPASIFPFLIGLAFMYPIISCASGSSRESKAANLTARRDALLLELGCGEDCEFGCRRY